MRTSKRTALAIWAVLGAPAAALGQAADGSYPGTIACDPGPDGRGAVRGSITVEIGGGRARYALGGGQETGTGGVTGRQLVLTGRGPGYEARYVGEVGGRGGMLTGTRTGRGSSRACQILIGNGRG